MGRFKLPVQIEGTYQEFSVDASGAIGEPINNGQSNQSSSSLSGSFKAADDRFNWERELPMNGLDFKKLNVGTDAMEGDKEQQQQQQQLGTMSPTSPKSAWSEVSKDISLSDDTDGLSMSEDEFKLLKEGSVLGQGSAGVVVKALSQDGNQEYAIKRIPLDKDESKRKAFLTEVRTMLKCDNPHVVKCHGVFFDDGVFSIVMDYYRYGSLLDLLEKARVIPEPILACIAMQLCDALHYLHTEKRVVHRDVKPPNILIDESGKMALADFSVSGILTQSRSKCASWVGTVTYMSPERIRSGQGYGPNSDMWSLGLVLLEAATGSFPYVPKEGTTLSFWDVLDLVVNRPAPIPGQDSNLSPDFLQFLSGCLEKDPSRRIQAIHALRHPWIEKHRHLADKASAWVQRVFQR